MSKADHANILRRVARSCFGHRCEHHVVACQRHAAANHAQDSVPSNIKIASDQEPGEPLIVSGTIYSPDGKHRCPESRSTFIKPMQLAAIQRVAATIAALESTG